MKKVRIFLSVLALVLGVGGTIAGQLQMSPNMTGYEFIPASGGTPDQCVQRSVNCNTTDPNLCTLNSHKVGDSSDTSTQCGNQLNKQ